MATLIGLAISTFRGGPFGFFGFMLEWAGVNSLLANPASNDFGIIVIGAVFVVIGTIFWSWKPVLRHVLQSRQNRGRHPGRLR